MVNNCPELADIIQVLTTLPQQVEEQEIVRLLVPLLSELVLREEWILPDFYQVDSEQGWSLYTLYDNPEHKRGVFVTAWLPGRGTPPHDHGSWAVIGGVKGTETNRFWSLAEDNAATSMQCEQEVYCGPGDVIAMRSDQIHSVSNDTNEITLSVHIYGLHPDYALRKSYDIASGQASTFMTKKAKS